MMAFIAAMGAEIASGKTVVEQVASAPVGVALMVWPARCCSPLHKTRGY